MKLNGLKMLPFAKEIMLHMQDALEIGYELMAEYGFTIDDAILSKKISEKLLENMNGWNPTYKKIVLLDDETRKAGSDFIAGVVCAMLKNRKEKT